jgi:orotate phosphoribosyltransferase-like protein
MKDEETIARFIHLRAQGWSFARIATELNVSKPTLVLRFLRFLLVRQEKLGGSNEL